MKGFFLTILLILFTVQAVDNGLGLTPQMGWNTWNKFACNINETLIKKSVDLLISTGLSAKGYNYVNLDDCWQVKIEFYLDFKKLDNKINY